MIKHIGKLIWNQRKRNGWIAAELFFVFVIMWFIIDELLVTSKVFYTPQGFNIERVYQVNFGYEEANDTELSIGEAQLQLLERLKTCPGIEYACAGHAAIPYDGQNSVYTYYVCTQDSVISKGINAKTLQITPEYMDVFEFQSIDKQSNWADKLSNHRVIVSYDLHEKIKEYGGSQQDGLAANINNPSEIRIFISGITTPFRSNRFQKDAVWLFEELRSEEVINRNIPLKFAIKVRPEADHDFESFFTQQMEDQLSIGPFYLMGLTSLKDKRIAYEFLTGEKAEVEKKLAISFFLLVNIFLSIIATFWYRTGQRTNEIGLRMAMGSSRSKVKKLIRTEGILLLTFIFIPATIICLNMQLFELNNQFYMDYTVGRFLLSIGCTYFIIAGMIFLGIHIPAQRASNLQPAEALHNE